MTTLFDTGRDEHGKVKRSAEISECGKYRWWLRRHWGTEPARNVTFIMLNPSKADHEQDDNTIRRCIDYARRWGFNTLTVKNLFCLRATNPKELLTAEDPVGARADAEIRAAFSSELVVCAWGTNVPFGRDKKVLELLGNKPLFCLELSVNRCSPLHPLRLRKDKLPLPWRNCSGVFLSDILRKIKEPDHVGEQGSSEGKPDGEAGAAGGPQGVAENPPG